MVGESILPEWQCVAENGDAQQSAARMHGASRSDVATALAWVRDARQGGMISSADSGGNRATRR